MDLIDENKKRWLASDKVSQKDKNLILKMNKEEADEAFFKDIEFGTAGMRGILGPGTNKMNEFTVRKATIGFAMYILEQFHECPSKSIVISHDNRFMSREFTLQSAEI